MENKEQIVKDFEAVRDTFGMVPPQVGQSVSDNGVLYTAEYILLLNRVAKVEVSDLTYYNNVVSPCFDKGLVRRTPGNADQDSPDNMIGLAAASDVLRDGRAAEILQYGRSTKFPHHIYNQNSPGTFSWRAWMGRQQGMIGFIRLCAGEKPNLIQRLFLYAGVYLASRAEKGETSNRLLTELVVERLEAHGYAPLVCRYWRKHIKDTYGGINAVVKIYFGPNHPFTRYWK